MFGFRYGSHLLFKFFHALIKYTEVTNDVFILVNNIIDTLNLLIFSSFHRYSWLRTWILCICLKLGDSKISYEIVFKHLVYSYT